MKALRQLGFFKLPFRQDEPEHEDGRVLALFRNRAELKKAYGELQDEIYRLKDRIKQQEGATQRVQEMLNALELRLGIPDSAYPALVFYQLRKLWQSGREIIFFLNERHAALIVPLRALFGRAASRHKYDRQQSQRTADERGSKKPLIHFLAQCWGCWSEAKFRFISFGNTLV